MVVARWPAAPFERYTQHVAREARGKWVRHIRIVALMMFGILTAFELFLAFVFYQFEYSYEFGQLGYEAKPGPWNGGHHWSREMVNAKTAQFARSYRQQLWGETIPVLAAILVALLVAVGCTLFLVIDHRRLPHFNELM